MIGSTIIGAGRLTAGRKNGFSRTPLDAFRIEHGPNFLIADGRPCQSACAKCSSSLRRGIRLPVGGGLGKRHPG